jgi:hypothetical protein
MLVTLVGRAHSGKSAVPLTGTNAPRATAAGFISFNERVRICSPRSRRDPHGSRAAHAEHTVAITEDGPRVRTLAGEA